MSEIVKRRVIKLNRPRLGIFILNTLVVIGFILFNTFLYLDPNGSLWVKVGMSITSLFLVPIAFIRPTMTFSECLTVGTHKNMGWGSVLYSWFLVTMPNAVWSCVALGDRVDDNLLYPPTSFYGYTFWPFAVFSFIPWITISLVILFYICYGIGLLGIEIWNEMMSLITIEYVEDVTQVRHSKHMATMA